MENASKALIMAATVLLGIMIAAIIALLFSIFSDYVIQLENKKQEYRLMEFNEKIYKYYSADGSIKITAHDVVSLANLAKENNEYYELDGENRAQNSTNYLQMVVIANNLYTNFEKKSSKEYSEFIKQFSYRTNSNGDVDELNKYFKCSEIKLNSEGRINYIKIDQI